MCTLTGHTRGVRSVAFSPDGTRVVSGGNDSLVKVWDVDTSVEVSAALGEGLTGWRGDYMYMYIYIDRKIDG